MFRRSRVRLFSVFALLAAAALGGWMYRQHHRYKHLAVHEPGMVYRSAWLEPDVMNEVIERYQIRTVVNLCRPGEMGEQRWVDERRTVSDAGARLVELEMPTSVDLDDQRIAGHLDVLGNPDNYPLLVHCQHGVTRTAKLLSIYDIVFRGLTADESLSAQPLFGRDDHNVHVKAFVYEFEKRHEQQFPTARAETLDVLRR